MEFSSKILKLICFFLFFFFFHSVFVVGGKKITGRILATVSVFSISSSVVLSRGEVNAEIIKKILIMVFLC